MAGLSFDADEFVTRGDQASGAFSVYHYRKGKLIAVDSVNEGADHMIARRLLAGGYSPPPAVVGDVTQDLKALI